MKKKLLKTQFSLLRFRRTKLITQIIFKSDIAVILNIYFDHLERHNNFFNYVKVKSQLILNQNFNSKAIICKNNKF